MQSRSSIGVGKSPGLEELTAISWRYTTSAFTRYIVAFVALAFVLSSFMFIAAADKYVKTKSEADSAIASAATLKAELEKQQKDLDRASEERQQDRLRWEQEKLALELEVTKLGKSARQLQPIAKLSIALMEARQLFTSRDYEGAANKYEEAFALSQGTDADILNQAAWSYYIAGTKSEGDSTDDFAKAQQLFELGSTQFTSNVDLKLNYALFRTERDGFSLDVAKSINELVSLDPAKAAIFASAPQTRRLRVGSKETLASWRECLAGLSEERGRGSSGVRGCALDVDDQNRPIFGDVPPVSD